MMTPSRLAAALTIAGHWCPGGLFTDERGVEFMTGYKPRTLRAWRAEGKGPPATQLARIAYDLQDLSEWMNTKSNRQGAASSGRKRQIAADSGIH